jgi:hypothetical protein
VSTEGCFDTLELHDLEANTGVALVLDANYYLDAETQQRKVKLQGKCQLAELPGRRNLGYRRQRFCGGRARQRDGSEVSL